MPAHSSPISANVPPRFRSLDAAIRSVPVILLSVTLAACGPRPERPIRVGVLALMKDEMAIASGVPSKRGVEMAIDEVNARGGVEVDGKKRRLEMVVRDYDPRPDAAASMARALVNLDSVDLVIGPQISAHAITAGSVAEDAHVPMIAPMASNPAVTTGRRFVFRLAYLDPFMGEMLARYARNELRATRAAVLYDAASPYGRDISALFRKTFEESGGRVVASETYTTDQRSDYRDQLRRVAAASPEVLLLPNPSAADSFQVRQARALGIRATFLATDIWDPPSLRHIPETHGVVYSRQWHPDMPRAATTRFTTTFASRYHEEPRSSAAMSYDAVMIAVEAMRRARTVNGDALRDAIASTVGFEGATGTISFNGGSDPKRSGVLARIGPKVDEILRVVDPVRP